MTRRKRVRNCVGSQQKVRAVSGCVCVCACVRCKKSGKTKKLIYEC
jgi:hypothetical protein